MNNKSLPPELRDKQKRDKFANDVVNLIQASIDERAGLNDRWKAVQGFYDGATVPWSCRYWKGVTLRHFPLIKPKVDALGSFVLETITNPSPMMLGKMRGSSRRLKGVEDQLQFFFNVGGLNQTLEELSPITGNTNNGVLRITFETSAGGYLPLKPQRGAMHGPVSFTGLQFDVVHPNDFVIYPHNCHGIQTAQLTGHRFYRQVRDIEALQRLGRYLDDVKIQSGSGPEEHESGRDYDQSRLSPLSPPKPQDGQAELFECIVKWDLGAEQVRRADGRFDKKPPYNERYWRVTVSIDPVGLLKIEPWHLSRPNYADFRYQPKQYGSWWSSGSVGNDLQGLQMQKIDVRNLLNYGSQYNMFKPIFTDSALPGKKLAIEPGGLYAAGGAVSSPSSGFDPGTLLAELDWIERDADAITRIPQAGTGQQANRGGQPITAREAGQLGAAMNTGINKYISTFGQGLTDTAEIACELLFFNFELWQPIYGGPQMPEEVKAILQQVGIDPGDSQVFVENPQDFLLPLQWELQGRSQDATPDVQFQKLQLAKQIAVEANMRAIQMGSPTLPYDLDALDEAIIENLHILNTDKFKPEGGVPNAAMGAVLSEPGMGGGEEAFGGPPEGSGGGFPPEGPNGAGI